MFRFWIPLVYLLICVPIWIIDIPYLVIGIFALSPGFWLWELLMVHIYTGYGYPSGYTAVRPFFSSEQVNYSIPDYLPDMFGIIVSLSAWFILGLLIDRRVKSRKVRLKR